MSVWKKEKIILSINGEGKEKARKAIFLF